MLYGCFVVELRLRNDTEWSWAIIGGGEEGGLML